VPSRESQLYARRRYTEFVPHSIGKLPIGGFFSVDGGKIALRRDDISLNHLRHSFNVGLTVRAGGLPVFYLLFAWGGNVVA
jgi:hypothetical protein